MIPADLHRLADDGCPIVEQEHDDNLSSSERLFPARDTVMQASDFSEKLREQKCTAETNQRYHQIKQSRMWFWDKLVKIAVAVFAMGALLAVFLPHEWKWLEIMAAIAATLCAIVLNVIPVGEWMAEYGEMFRSWSDLVQMIDLAHLKLHRLVPDAPIPEHLVERLEEISGRSLQLDAMEHAANMHLLEQCQGDVIERMYGKGTRTFAQAMAASRQEEAVVDNG